MQPLPVTACMAGQPLLQRRAGPFAAAATSCAPLITTIIAALRVFDLVYVTTRGGPGDSTLVTGFLVYRAAFQQNRIGYATAVATIMTLVIFIISLVVLRFQSREEQT